LIAVSLLVVFQLVFTYVPVFQTWFGTGPMTLRDWGWALGAGLAVFVIVEVEKALMRGRRAAEGDTGGGKGGTHLR
jgi:hypothetical protein